MDSIYKVRTIKSLEAAVSAVKKKLSENGFGTLFELSFKEKVKERGL